MPRSQVDTISQVEYYQLFAFFNNADNYDYNFPVLRLTVENFNKTMEKHLSEESKLDRQISEAIRRGADPTGKLNKLINQYAGLKRKAVKFKRLDARLTNVGGKLIATLLT